MMPQTQARKPKNSSRINLIISLVFHGALVFVILYFAARGGILGKTMQNMTVNMVKEKPVEKKEPEKQPEPPKETPKLATVAPTITHADTAPTAPAPSSEPAAMAPPAVDVAAFDFDGGRQVISADPITLYKSAIQSAVLARWKRPDTLADRDKDFIADVEVTVDTSGHISHPDMTRSSRNQQWDDSVLKAITETADLGQVPPKGFPSRVIVRFDVQEQQADSILQ
jgi:outer membrane biosynthesis protein TonB